jgi:hypothetical protein
MGVLEGAPRWPLCDAAQHYFQSAEPVYFRVRSRSVAGLEAYLAALPDGPHAAEALELLVGLKNERRREDLAERATRATLLRVEGEGRARMEAAELVGWWTHAMLAPSVWSRTFADAPADLLARFRLTAPEPTCVRTDGDERCTKDVVRAFRIRGPGGEVERALRLRVEVNLDRNYRLVAFALSGDGLASSSAEAAAGTVGAPSDEAKAWRAFVEALGARVFKDGRACTGGEDADGTYRLACEEPRVNLLATRDADGHEAIWLTRAP